jgi:glycosyltransferase involved in cell wall biosynthesis
MGSVQATVLAGDADARVMRALSPGSLVEVIPNGVRVMDQGTIEESPEPTVIFSGVMAFPPNVEAVTFFCHTVWPHVREAVPTARFLIAGKHPVREVQNLAACAGVEVLGAVDDMAAVLGRAWVAVAPMRSGAGIKNKVLEAWAAGKPTVMTTLAVGGLHLVESERALVRDEPREMAGVISRLLLDGEERRRRGSVALQAVRSHHSWEGVAGTLTALLERVRSRSGQ